MAILENIRKRTTILILIIGLALFAFVVSGIFTSSSMGGGAKVGSAIGEINGEEVSIDAFRRKMESESQAYGANMTSMQLVNRVWNQEVRSSTLGQQIEELGINIEQDQIINFIKTNPGYSQNPQFLNENGVFDQNKFREFILDIKENSPAQYSLWLQQEKSIMQSAKEQIYFNLIKAGVGATLKEGELSYKLANDKVSISYARVPYSSIADSSVTVSKKEIAAYITAHREEFKQEKSRDVQFVYFQEKSSVEDEAAIKGIVSKLLEDTIGYNDTTKETDTVIGFRKTNDLAAFLDRNSDVKYDTVYRAKKDLSIRFADTLATLKVGEVYGPYKDGNTFKISRMVGKKANASVKTSHVLIMYEGAERANPTIKRTKEEAEKEANRLLKEAKKTDVVFTQLARDNSDGPSAANGGDLGYFQEGVMTAKFNDFAFSNKVGHIGLLETEFGFHIIKVDDKRDLYRVATLVREIEPSEETINKLFTDATKFEMDASSKDNSFLDVAKESTYLVRPVNKIKALDENLPGLSAQRNVVQWAFNEDTEVGAVKRFNINNGYAVVQLTAKYKEGLSSVEDASASVLSKLRNEKKATQIISANQGKSMEDFAKDNNVSLSNASALTMNSPTIPGAGREALVVGSAFALNLDGTSGLIQGESGVFVIKVTKKEEAAKLDNYSTYANTLKTSNVNKVFGAVPSALKAAAEIEDNRAVFY